MAEIQSNELLCKSKHFVGKVQTIQEGRITVSDCEIKKVLKTSTDVVISHCEILNGQAKITGKTKFCVVFLTTNNEVRHQDLDVEWTDKLDNDAFAASQDYICRADVVDSDITSVSSGEIRLTSVIDSFVFIIRNNACNYVMDANNLVTKKQKINFSTVSNFQRAKIKSSFEIDTKIKEMEICETKYFPTVKEVKVVNGSLRIDAEVEACLTYVNKQEDCHIATINETVSVVEEVDGNFNENSVYEVAIKILSSKTNFKQGEISVVMELEVVIIETGVSETEVVEDAFSVTHETNKTFETVEIVKLVKCENFIEKISSNANVDSNDMQLNKVLGASIKNVIVSNIYAIDEAVVVEGVAQITAMCEVSEGESEDKALSSIDVEVPFSIKNKDYDIIKDQHVTASVVVCDPTVKHKRTNDIEVNAVIKISVSVYSKENLVLLKNIEMGEEKMSNPNSISIFVSRKEETMFTLAKRIGVTIEQLLEQNDELASLINQGLDIPENTMLVVYRQQA